ncbi:hypothetical protein Tco_0604719 [Tanacetum coccineum]
MMESVHPSAHTEEMFWSFEQRIVGIPLMLTTKDYRSDCPVLKNQGTEAQGMVYVLGGGETNQDIDNTKGDENPILRHILFRKILAFSRRYSSMIRMLQNIDREDVEALWRLAKAKHGNTRPEEAYKRVLWGDLKVMF